MPLTCNQSPNVKGDQHVIWILWKTIIFAIGISRNGFRKIFCEVCNIKECDWKKYFCLC